LKKETQYLYSLTLLYLIVSVIGILHHELWLDEAHHWLLSRDSTSLLDLIKNARYEGHPILWNVLLFGITRLTLNPIWMQFLHIGIATAAVFVFLKKAPFPWIFKILFIFGYFMIFEYNLISRNYILGVLFLFLACSVYEKRAEKFTLLCFYLALAANVHLIFVVLAFALFLTLLMEQLQQKKLFQKADFNWGYLIFSSGLLVACLQIIPPTDTAFFNRIDELAFHEKFTKGFIALFKGLLPIPDFRNFHFWNTNLLVDLNKSISAIVGLLCYGIPFLFFYKNKTVLFFVYIALLGVTIFFFFTQMSATRYDGTTYILFISALWIAKYYPSDSNRIQLPFSLLKKTMLYSILSIQFLSGIYAYAMDYQFSFSPSKEVVTFLKEKNLATKPIVCVTCDGTAISPYLEKKIFFLCDGSEQSFCHWNFNCAMNISDAEIQQALISYMTTHNEAVYVSNYPIFKNKFISDWIALSETVEVRYLKSFDHSILRNSAYYIYEIEKRKVTFKSTCL